LSAGLFTWKFLKKTFARKKVMASSTMSALSVIEAKNQHSCIGGSKPSIVLSVDRIPGSEVGAGPFI